jgi:hypothetical protein
MQHSMANKFDAERRYSMLGTRESDVAQALHLHSLTNSGSRCSGRASYVCCGLRRNQTI